MVHQLVERKPDKQCYIVFKDNPLFVIISTVVNYWAIIVVILVLYYKIYKITNFFWRRKRDRGIANGNSRPKDGPEVIQMKRLEKTNTGAKTAENIEQCVEDNSSGWEDSQNQQQQVFKRLVYRVQCCLYHRSAFENVL